LITEVPTAAMKQLRPKAVDFNDRNYDSYDAMIESWYGKLDTCF